MSSADRTMAEIEYSAEQIRTALIDASRDGESEKVKEGLAALLAIHYPHEFEQLRFTAELIQLGDDHG